MNAPLEIDGPAADSSEPYWLNDQTWTTRAGDTLRLEEMTAEHREHVITFRGRGNAQNLRNAMGWAHALRPPLPMDGDAIHDWYDGEAYRIDEQPVAELLESLPLVKRLRWLNRKPAVFSSISLADLPPIDDGAWRERGDEDFGVTAPPTLHQQHYAPNPVLLAFREYVDGADVSSLRWSIDHWLFLFDHPGLDTEASDAYASALASIHLDTGQHAPATYTSHARRVLDRLAHHIRSHAEELLS